MLYNYIGGCCMVYIKKEELNEWIAKYFKNDLISIDDMLGVIEDLDGQVNHLKEELERVMTKDDWEGYDYGE